MKIRSLPGAALMLCMSVWMLVGALAVSAPGGEAAGARLSWRPLPMAPIVGRLDASTVWTGREMIVWGGVNRPAVLGSAAPRSDGAAYDPSTGRWRMIANSPSGVLGGGGPAAVWTGTRMVVFVGNSPDGPAAAGAYDPRSNTWRRLPKGPLGVRESYASVWTGRELLIFGGHSGDMPATPTAAALNPATGSWRRLKALDAITDLGTVNGALWNGRDAFVSGVLYRPPGRFSRPILLDFNPRTNKLHEIDLANAPLNQRQRMQLDPVGRSGSDIVFWTGASSSSAPVVRYNPTTGRWKRGKAAPCKPYGQIAWIGDRLAVACATDQLEIYEPRSDSWETLSAGPSPFNSRESSELVWTGRELIVWSGVAHTRYNPTPADGASLAGLAEARQAPRCTVRQLRARAGLTIGGAGDRISEFAFVNQSRAVCTLFGYPHVRMLNAAGHPIATTDHNARPGFLGIPRKVVTLAKGASAWFGVEWHSQTGFANRTCPTAVRLLLYPPQRTRAVVLSGNGAHIAPYGGTIEHLRCGLIGVTPVTAKRFQ